MISVQQSVAHPWMCDVLGHLTTRYYVGMFDDAAYHFLYTVFGWTGSSDEEGKKALVDVRHLIEYRNEVPPGELLEICACLTRIGTKSITCYYQMTKLGSNEIVATLEVVSVLFDLQARCGIPLTDELREAAANHLVEPQEGA
jgi:acyl-CoA thioester hydrolase